LTTDLQPPHVWIADIKEEGPISGCYLAKSKRMGTTRAGKPFINFVLADRTGELEAKVWDRAEDLSSVFKEGEVIEVRGRAGSYRGQIQITVSDISAPEGEFDPAVFLETSRMDLSETLKSLRKLLRNVKNHHLKMLNDRFLSDRDFISRFKQAPAAKNFHHSYLGGLLEHTLSVCQMAVQVAEHYPQLDVDLLLTASFLHDIGKIREFEHNLHIDYSDEGRLLGHLVIGSSMVEEKLSEMKGFPAELAVRLKHMILSHHGEYEFGSPKRPKFVEAFVLHLLDDLDAKVNGLGRLMEKDRSAGPWTDYNQMFGRHFLKGNLFSVEEDPDGSERTDDPQGLLFSF
jgi:3'-5' exoribonuclease